MTDIRAKRMLSMAFVRDGEDQYRVELGGVDITEYIASLETSIDQEQIDVSRYTTTSEAMLLTVPGRQRTRVDLRLVNVELIYSANSTAGRVRTEDLPRLILNGARRRVSGGE